MTPSLIARRWWLVIAFLTDKGRRPGRSSFPLSVLALAVQPDDRVVAPIDPSGFAIAATANRAALSRCNNCERLGARWANTTAQTFIESPRCVTFPEVLSEAFWQVVPFALRVPRDACTVRRVVDMRHDSVKLSSPFLLT